MVSSLSSSWDLVDLQAVATVRVLDFMESKNFLTLDFNSYFQAKLSQSEAFHDKFLPFVAWLVSTDQKSNRRFKGD